MPRGVTRSTLSLHERRRVAFEMFTQGYTNRQVADRLSIHPGTAKMYREEWEASIQQEAVDNPELLRDVITNTTRQLAELDLVRQRAWQEYETASSRQAAHCPTCAETVYVDVSSPTTRNQLLNTITKAQELRAKLLGLFGVKAEFMLHVQSVRAIQEKLIGFMRNELCAEDKEKLERLLTDASDDVHRSNMPMLPVGVDE